MDVCERLRGYPELLPTLERFVDDTMRIRREAKTLDEMEDGPVEAQRRLGPVLK